MIKHHHNMSKTANDAANRLLKKAVGMFPDPVSITGAIAKPAISTGTPPSGSAPKLGAPSKLSLGSGSSFSGTSNSTTGSAGPKPKASGL